MTIKAYSYIRFSRPEQIRGNSLARQKEMSMEYCKEHDLILDTSLNLYDPGVSAFEGNNIDQGMLGAFLKAIKKGKVSAGSYLLIESLDRLSRQAVPTALKLFLSILEQQITIVTLCDGMKYEQDNLNTSELIISITIMARAHEESQLKSKRLRAAWKGKRENISNIKMSRVAVAWLELNEDRTQFNLVPDRVSIVQDIFKWSLDGLGIHRIIQRLEDLNIKPFGKSNTWHPAYIQKILKSRAVLGELTSNSKERTATLQNYYPAIITEEQFYRTQNAIKSRNISGGGRKGKTIANLFQKIIFCGYSTDNNKSGYRCSGNNETVIIANKGSKKKKGHKYLQCSKQKRGSNGCPECHKLWRHDHFEVSFLSFVSEIDISSLVETTDELKRRIDEIQARLVSDNEKLKHIQQQKLKITNAVLNSEAKIPEFILQEGNRLEEQEQAVLENIRTNNSNLKSAQHDYNQSDKTQERLSQLISVMPTLEENDLYELRQQLSTLLKNIIERIEIYSCGTITTEEYINEIRKTQGKKAANIIIKNKEQSEGKHLPYFIVYFKSGSYRLVATDPTDPTRLVVSLTPQGAESMLLGQTSSPD